jgi:hypothetical protein
MNMLLLKISWLLLLRSNIHPYGAAAFKFGLDISHASRASFNNKHIQRHSSGLLVANAIEKNNMVSTDGEYQLFGRFKIETKQIFYRSSHSFATVNLRPLVPGHVLVVSNRVVPLLSDLECKFIYLSLFLQS